MHSFGKIIASCYGLNPSDFLYVFNRSEEAPSGDSKPFDLNSYRFHIDENAQFAPGRTLVEIMYRVLHEPGIFNKSFLHLPGRPFGNLSISRGGEFLHDHRVANNGVPHFDEIYESFKMWRAHKGKSERAAYLSLLRETLARRVADPDNFLEEILS